MRVRGILIVLAALGGLFTSAFAHAQQSADSMQMDAEHALVWDQGKTNVVELTGPVKIQLDHTELTANDAVIWITPSPGAVAGEQRVEIALMGSARLEQNDVIRTEDNLLVTATVRGAIRLNAEHSALDDSSSPLYTQAAALRTAQSPALATPVTPTPGPATRKWSESALLSKRAAMLPGVPPPLPPKQSVQFNLSQFDLVHAENGDLALVFPRALTVIYQDAKDDLLEFEAGNAVLFTDLKSLQGMGSGADLKRYVSNHIVSAYFEKDVRVFVTPATSGHNEMRMRAERVFYVFATDRAVMTDVLFHTVDVKRQIPILMRAQTLRQLSQGEYNMDNVLLTTSAFATPTYGLYAQKAYVKTDDTGGANGDTVSFEANNAFLDMFGLPVFYFPQAGGTMSSRGGVLRSISVNEDSNFGYGVRTQLGLFESLGMTPPTDLDAAYRLDYFSFRGPAGGLDARYEGGFVDETTKDPWNFLGDLHSYFVYDHGTDVLGASRANENPPQEFRGRAYLQHQDFFPDDWQLQLRLGYLSDANFMTQWFPDEARNNLPIDESFYLKHQKDSEVFSLLGEWQPNGVVTVTEDEAEQREVERLPEVQYHVVGQSFADDNFTFFSDNSATALNFAHSSVTLTQQGFYEGFGPIPSVEPGLAAFAYTGDPNSPTYRGDFRQEIDWPINAGPIKIVPYVFGRYTAYSQGVHLPYPLPIMRTIPTSVDLTGDQNRIMGGGGLRATTAFWKVDDTVESDLFDLHRLRHVIEPELNVFGSAATIDQSHLFIYDPNVDAVNAIQAAQVALRQRWQTKRGGPGRWRSVDFFTLNLYGNFVGNQPAPLFRDPVDFRGLFFESLPEASLPRNSANADMLWRISDSTAVLGDLSENLDRTKLATASIGISLQRGDRLSFFLGNRYIADLDSNLTTVDVTYELTRKYALDASEIFDFGQSKSVYYTASLIRKFDRMEMGLNVYYDQASNESGVSFSFTPYGFGRGVGTDRLNQMPQ